MPHANLDQLRAAHAHEAAKSTDRASVAKLPGMILTNGLLATLAFACEKDNRNQSRRPAQQAAADSLAALLTKRLPTLGPVTTGDALAAKLAAGDALTLQRATTEALAYLTYLKRYAAPKTKES